MIRLHVESLQLACMRMTSLCDVICARSALARARCACGVKETIFTAGQRLKLALVTLRCLQAIQSRVRAAYGTPGRIMP